MMIFNDGWLADQTIDYLFVTELTEFGDKNVVLVKSVGIWNHESMIAKLPRLPLGQQKNQRKWCIQWNQS